MPEKLQELSNLTSVALVKKSFEFVKLRDYARLQDVVPVLSSVFVTCNIALGNKGDITAFDFQDIFKMIQIRFKSLSVEEIGKALEMDRYGVNGVPTVCYGLFNAEYVRAVLDKYVNWKTETRLVHGIDPKRVEETIEPTAEEIYDIMSAGIESKYKHWLETGEIEYPVKHIFAELISRGDIFPTNDIRYERYYAGKLHEAKAELTKELIKTNRGKLVRPENKLSEVLKGFDKTRSGQIELRFIQLVLADFFKHRKSTEKK